MSKLTIKNGNGELTLKKSKTLVGLKTKEDKDQAFVDKHIFKNLAGFEVATLNQGDKNLDDALDEVRGKDEVELGTHVYFTEGSERPLVPTGEIYITFVEGVY